jgi:hypothetical protein
MLPKQTCLTMQVLFATALRQIGSGECRWSKCPWRGRLAKSLHRQIDRTGIKVKGE